MQRPSMRRLVSRRSFFLAPPRGRPLRDLSATSLVISGLHAAASRKRGSSRGRKRWLALRKGVGKHLRRPSLAWATRASADVEAPAVTARLLSFSIGLRKERGGAGAGRPRAARDRRQSASDLAVLDVGLGSGGALGMSFAWKVQRALAASGVSSLRFRQPAEESQRSGFTGKEGLLRSWALARIAVISGVGAPLVSC